MSRQREANTGVGGWRTVGELLADSDELARETLLDATPDHAPAMVRSWNQLVRSAAELGAVLPSGPNSPSELDPANVRRDLRRALKAGARMEPKEWTPRELHHSFVSVSSDSGVPVEEISQLIKHSGTSVKLVYGHQLRPVIQTGATVMDRLFSLRVQRISRLAHVPLPARPFRAENGLWPSGDAVVPMVL